MKYPSTTHKSIIVLVFAISSVLFVKAFTASPIPYLQNDSSLIGTMDYAWEDRDRIDEYYNTTRKINVRVWYPAEKDQHAIHSTSYLPFAKEIKRLGDWDLEAYEAKLNSYPNLPIDKNLKNAPLLVFSPSLGGNLAYYTYYAEYFSKKGFVVMGINHLYESEVVIMNNEVLLNNEQFHDSLKSLDIPLAITADEYRKVKEIRHKVLAEDIHFAIDQLLATDFGQVIDSNLIGAFGHSIGGAATIYATLIDSRIKALVDLDGTPPATALVDGIDVPFLFLEDLNDYKAHKGQNMVYQRRSSFCRINKKDSWRILFQGFDHNSFLDYPYYLPSSEAEAATTKRNLDLVIRYMDRFFTRYLLRSEESVLDDLPTNQGEVLKFLK